MKSPTYTNLTNSSNSPHPFLWATKTSLTAARPATLATPITAFRDNQASNDNPISKVFYRTTRTPKPLLTAWPRKTQTSFRSARFKPNRHLLKLSTPRQISETQILSTKDLKKTRKSKMLALPPIKTPPLFPTLRPLLWMSSRLWF